MATKGTTMVAYVPNGYGYLTHYFNVDAWFTVLQKMPDFGARVLNYDFDKRNFEGCSMVERATGWELMTRQPLEWDMEGFCFVRDTKTRMPQYDLFWMLREVRHE